MCSERYCEVCGRILKPDETTYDLMISCTRHGKDGEPTKTMIEPPDGLVNQDYYVIGDCCGELIASVWNEMLVRAVL